MPAIGTPICSILRSLAAAKFQLANQTNPGKVLGKQGLSRTSLFNLNSLNGVLFAAAELFFFVCVASFQRNSRRKLLFASIVATRFPV